MTQCTGHFGLLLDAWELRGRLRPKALPGVPGGDQAVHFSLQDHLQVLLLQLTTGVLSSCTHATCLILPADAPTEISDDGGFPSTLKKDCFITLLSSYRRSVGFNTDT